MKENSRWVLGVKNVRWVLGVAKVFECSMCKKCGKKVYCFDEMCRGFTVRRNVSKVYCFKKMFVNPLGFVWQLNAFLLTEISRYASKFL